MGDSHPKRIDERRLAWLLSPAAFVTGMLVLYGLVGVGVYVLITSLV